MTADLPRPEGHPSPPNAPDDSRGLLAADPAFSQNHHREVNNASASLPEIGPQDPRDPATLLRDYAVQARRPESKKFWPWPLLLHILSKERLRKQLTSYNKWRLEKVNQMVDTIRPRDTSVEPESPEGRTHYVRIFALLLLMGKGGDIINFIDAEESDIILPVEVLPSHLGRKLYSLARTEEPARAKEEVRASVSSGWEITHMETFEEKQWGMFPAYFGFDGKGKEYKLEDGRILPFLNFDGSETHSGTTSEKLGAYGIVTQIKLCPHSHGFDGILKKVGMPGRQVFALKTLNPLKKNTTNEDFNQFKRELEQLRRFNGTVHRHLVTLLASYEHGGRYHFLFPWAKSTLEKFWETSPKPLDSDADAVIWVAEQLEGITGAINAIHEPKDNDTLQVPGEARYGRHGDLKPDNILLFETDHSPRGTLVVTDLGLSTYNRVVSRSAHPGINARIPGYRAPECDIIDGTATRGTDIWSLGCLYLELLTWLLGGYALVEKFKDQRTAVDHVMGTLGSLFFEFKPIAGSGLEGEIRVKEAVTKFITGLHALPNCTKFTHEALNIIEEKMLLVKGPKYRDSSKLLLPKFQDLREKCEKSRRGDVPELASYTTGGKPIKREDPERPAIPANLHRKDAVASRDGGHEQVSPSASRGQPDPSRPPTPEIRVINTNQLPLR